MSIHLVTFATDDMSRSRELCIKSALRNGCESANGSGIDYLQRFPSFQENWSNERGIGWWHWKPIVIQQALHEHLTNDIVIYADAGVEFIAPVSHIIDRMDQDIFLFGNNWEHAHWCKRDVIDAVYRDHEKPWGLLSPWPYFGKQCQASVVFFRVSDYTRTFVKEWLDWCLYEGGRLIDDSPCRFNHPEFREHRHDQAILTTMAYREGISLHYWPAVYNLGYPLPRGGFVYEKLACYANDDYPSPLFHHHRRRNYEWKA